MYINPFKKKNMHVPAACLLAMLCFFTTSCNDEDDIDAIFTGQTWYLGDFYHTSNWKDDNNQKAVYSRNPEAMKMIIANGRNRFYITFQEKTFTARGTGNTFSGTWSADGKTNELHINITQGSPSHGSGLEQEITRKFYDYIKSGKFYRGNTLWLKFYPEDKKSFMQLSKNRIE